MAKVGTLKLPVSVEYEGEQYQIGTVEVDITMTTGKDGQVKVDAVLPKLREPFVGASTIVVNNPESVAANLKQRTHEATVMHNLRAR